jgi:hypothetical protein
MDPDIGYAEARRLIDEKYGDPYNISNGFIKKMTEWPMLKPGDDGLNRFSTFLTQCYEIVVVFNYIGSSAQLANLGQEVTLPLDLP